jgi:hypothetical protein
MFCNMVTLTYHEDMLLLFLSTLVLHFSCSYASLHKMADKGRLSAEQCIKTVLFVTETRSAVVIQRQFHAHFQKQWVPSKQFINFITSLIMMVQCWNGNVAGVHLRVLQRTLMLSEDSSPCSGLSFFMLGSSIASEIKILLVDRILGSFHAPPCKYWIWKIYINVRRRQIKY